MLFNLVLLCVILARALKSNALVMESIDHNRNEFQKAPVNQSLLFIACDSSVIACDSCDSTSKSYRQPLSVNDLHVNRCLGSKSERRDGVSRCADGGGHGPEPLGA